MSPIPYKKLSHLLLVAVYIILILLSCVLCPQIILEWTIFHQGIFFSMYKLQKLVNLSIGFNMKNNVHRKRMGPAVLTVCRSVCGADPSMTKKRNRTVFNVFRFVRLWLLFNHPVNLDVKCHIFLSLMKSNWNQDSILSLYC